MTKRKSEWFSPEQKPAMVDFWTIYTAHYDAITGAVIRLRREQPDFAPWIRKRTATERQLVTDWRGITERAIEMGDWSEYEEGMLREGVEFSEMGVSFLAWSEVSFELQRQFTPLIVAAYGDDVPRMTAALLVMQQFIGRRQAVLGDAFLKGERDAEGRFRQLLEAAPDAVVIVDGAGRIALVNSQTEKLFGYPRTELVGNPVELLLPERFAEVYRRERPTYLGAPAESWQVGSDVELFGRRSDGSEVPIEVALSPLETQNGLFVCGAIRDVTERRQAAQALKNTNRELESFSYSVAHDLRAPLRAMNGFAQMLDEDYGERLDDAGRELLADIRSNALRMRDLIDALLTLSRVTRGGLRPEPIDLSALARETLARLNAEAPLAARELVVRDGLSAVIDASLARQLLDNLLSNAVKFSGKVATPRIEFGAFDEPGQVTYFVRDNGAGFDKSYAHKLFGPFQRLHHVSEFAGEGIGLATAQRIVHRHGGRIWAESEEGQGASFYFTLPA